MIEFSWIFWVEIVSKCEKEREKILPSFELFFSLLPATKTVNRIKDDVDRKGKRALCWRWWLESRTRGGGRSNVEPTSFLFSSQFFIYLFFFLSLLLEGSHFHSSLLPPPALHTDRERQTVCVGTLSSNTRPIGRVFFSVFNSSPVFGKKNQKIAVELTSDQAFLNIAPLHTQGAFPRPPIDNNRR